MFESWAFWLAICGAILPVWIAWLFRCRHAWTLVSDRDFPPIIEDIKRNAPGFEFFSYQIVRMSQRTYIAVVKCDKCGALKILRERS